MTKGISPSNVWRTNRRFVTGRVGLGIMAVLCMMLAMCSPVTATTLIPLAFEDVVAKAEHIIIGEVMDIRSELTPDEEKIYTFVTLKDVDSLEGPIVKDGIFTVRLSGGHVGDLHSIYLGMPEFEIGEVVMLFVHLNENAICPIVGWTQGFFRLVDEGQQEIVKDYSHNAIVGTDAMGNLQRANTAGAAPAVEGSPGVCQDGGDPGQVVANAFDFQPTMSSTEFINTVQDIRAMRGYQPEMLPKAPNTWISVPVDQNNAALPLPVSDAAQPAPDLSNVYIPREFMIDPADPEEEEFEAVVETEPLQQTDVLPAAPEMDSGDPEPVIDGTATKGEK